MSVSPLPHPDATGRRRFSTREVAEQLVGYYLSRRFSEAVQSLYADDVEVRGVSPYGLQGMAAVLEDARRFEAEHDITWLAVPNHYVADDTIIVEVVRDAVNKITGQKIHNDQITVFRVIDGKIVGTRSYVSES